ncbi:MAG TPA: hypothetical protein VGN63_19110 [Flavisolibacter sp.]|nr:hypothetical protein [Flavisolibacter sp.]
MSALQEELDAFLKRVSPNFRRLELDVALVTYKDQGNSIEILTFSADKMGMPYNAAKLMQIITTFHPKYVLFIGICAGLKGHKLGSVLIPKRVFSYESGKLEKGEFLPDYTSYETSDFLRKRAESLRNKEFNSFGYDVTTDEDFCSGSAVINDEGKVQEIKDNGARKLSGLEMEAFSVACINDIMSPHCELLVIKGISDKAINKDASETDGSRDLAKKNAADFALRLISYIESNERSILNSNELAIQPEVISELNATFKLKLKFHITNISQAPIAIESLGFEFEDVNNLDPITRIKHRKPLFLIGKGLNNEDIYKEFCVLKPGETPVSCWLPLNPSIGKAKADELAAKKKIGKWSFKFHSLGNSTYSYMGSFSV